jgi:hypothetical protein
MRNHDFFLFITRALRSQLVEQINMSPNYPLSVLIGDIGINNGVII